ncbi:MAG: bifunctional DNA-binding transcriptional regulator/O6-methylguanine-DNA methyltransferase Ada [Gammaproteobacteria bacterium]
MMTVTPIQLSDDQRWKAVRSRDVSLDGAFVYAVRTTGVFCRPSCPSRLSKRDNTEFFSSPAAALASGYRECKRCRPAEQAEHNHRAGTIRDACAMIEAAEDTPTAKELASDLGLSVSHLRREFKRLTGVTMREFAAGKRVERLQKALRQGRAVSDAIYEAGYGSGSRVYESARRTLGMTPAQYRDGGPGISISFTTAPSSLGLILVAATERGVCCIEFGEDSESLVDSLSNRFPAAHIERDESGLEEWLATVVRFIATPHAGLSLPLDIQGTAFQRRVWKALQSISIGSTSSYSEIATEIGKPKAHRAVARACAANPLAVAIPCHRVLRTDGSLGGYRWGLDRKTELLAREQSADSDSD